MSCKMQQLRVENYNKNSKNQFCAPSPDGCTLKETT